MIGGDEGDRTPDLCIANAALSQLSYTPELSSKNAVNVRFEEAYFAQAPMKMQVLEGSERSFIR